MTIAPMTTTEAVLIAVMVVLAAFAVGIQVGWLLTLRLAQRHNRELIEFIRYQRAIITGLRSQLREALADHDPADWWKPGGAPPSGE